MCVMCTLSGVTENIPNVPHIEDGKIIAQRIVFTTNIHKGRSLCYTV